MGNTLVNNPIAADTLAFDQPLMQSNNKYFAHTLIKDHKIGDSTANITGGHNDTDANEGYHTVIHFVNQGGNPGPVALTGEVYTRTISGFQELFYQNAAGNAMQLTNFSNDVNAAARFGNNSHYQAGPPSLYGGWTFLPGNILFQYGTHGFFEVLALQTSGTVTFPISFTAPFTPYLIQISLIAKVGGTLSENTISITAGTVTSTSFDWNYTGTTSYVGFTWTALGL